MANDREFLHVTGVVDSPMVLQMLLDEMKLQRATLKEHQNESRAEFRRIHDKIDALTKDVGQNFQEHDRDIVRLNEQAKMTGRAAGFIAGAVSSLMIYLVVAVAQWALNTFVTIG